MNRAGVRCRPIRDDELETIVAALREGFGRTRSLAYWREGLRRHAARALPEEYSRYGYLLEAGGGEIVGVLLTLHARAPDGSVRCNLSSWWVRPAFRAYAPLLDAVATRRAEVTYVNVSPAPSTWPMLERRGYAPYCLGQMLAVPALSRARPGAAARRIAGGDALADLAPAERTLVRDHLAYGCVGLLCTDGAGAAPILVQRRTIGVVANRKTFGQVPSLQLVYGRPADVARFAGPLGRALVRATGIPLVVIDADRRIEGLIGRYFPGRAVKYQRGPRPVALGDLAYTELVLFGP